jgi:hypothetical protein
MCVAEHGVCMQGVRHKQYAQMHIIEKFSLPKLTISTKTNSSREKLIQAASEPFLGGLQHIINLIAFEFVSNLIVPQMDLVMFSTSLTY